MNRLIDKVGEHALEIGFVLFFSTFPILAVVGGVVWIISTLGNCGGR